MELYLLVLSFISLHPVYLDLITVFPHLPLRKQQISHPYQLHKKKRLVKESLRERIVVKALLNSTRPQRDNEELFKINFENGRC